LIQDILQRRNRSTRVDRGIYHDLLFLRKSVKTGVRKLRKTEMFHHGCKPRDQNTAYDH